VLPFRPGLDLAEAFYKEVVGPDLEATFPGLCYAAARLGSGSDVLGFDTPRSMDHGWGPVLQIFIPDEQYDDLADSIHEHFRQSLPHRFRGIPTGFIISDGEGSRVLAATEDGPVEHGIEVLTVRRFLSAQFRFDGSREPTPRDWLIWPQQRLLQITAGRVFHDDLGLEAARQRFSWYPHDVWLYLMAGAWMRIGQEEPFVGRTAEAGDEIGSRLLLARLARDVMRLAFLIERRYAPYAKWFGTAFARLPCAANLLPPLEAALAAPDWPAREAALIASYEVLASMHNRLGVTAPLPTEATPFHDRPYLVIHGERFTDALMAQIEDPWLRSLPPLGGIDQISDNTNVLSYPDVFTQLTSLYPHSPDST